jgi:hypothetical protein
MQVGAIEGGLALAIAGALACGGAGSSDEGGSTGVGDPEGAELAPADFDGDPRDGAPDIGADERTR